MAASLAVDRLTFPANDWLFNPSFDEPPWRSSAFLGRKHEQRRRMLAPGALNLATISFEFAARSNAQKIPRTTTQRRKAQPWRRFLPPFIRQPNHNFHENPLAHFPDTTKIIESPVQIDWVVMLLLASDFLRH